MSFYQNNFTKACPGIQQDKYENLSIGELETDVLIVGSGPIAAVYAREILDKTQAKILMVDAGASGSPVPGSHLKNSAYFQKDVDQFTGIIKADLHTTSVPVDKRIEDTLGPNAFTVPYESFENGWATKRQNPEQNPSKNLSGAAVCYKVGGMGTHWTAACPKMHPDELGQLKDLVAEEELADLYARAEKLFDVTQGAFKTSMRQNAVLTFLKKEYKDDNIEEGKGPQPLPLSVRHKIRNKAFLEWGSTATVLGEHAAPSTLHKATAPTLAVNTARRLRILEQHICRKIKLEDDATTGKKVIKFALIHNLMRDEVVRVKAQKYIICCGTVLSAQLLHASGLGNGEKGDFLPALGRYLVEQPIAFCQIVMRRELVDYIKGQSGEEVLQHINDNPVDPIPIPMEDPDPQCWFPFSANRPWHCQIHRDAFAYGDLAPNVDSRLVVDLRWFTRVKPCKETRVKFSEKFTDIFDMPQPTFEWDMSDEARLDTSNAMKDMLRCATSLGSFLPGSEPQWMKPGLSLHIHGVTRMGKAKDDSVVDSNCQVHGVEDLYIGGLGVLPCEAACNPTLTAAAMALRSVDSIVKTLPPKVPVPYSEFGVPNFTAKKLATVADGYWIDAFDANGNGYPDILAYGLNGGDIILYLNPGQSNPSPTATWNSIQIGKFHQPVGASNGDITGNGKMDIAICCEYGNTMETINPDGGEIYWLENSLGTNPGTTPLGQEWTKRYVGKSPGMHRLELGHFTQSEKLEILALPVVSTRGDVTSAAHIKLFQQPSNIYEADQWIEIDVDHEHFHVIHAVQKKKFMEHVGNPLDSVVLASMEGISFFYWDDKSKKFAWETLVEGIGNSLTAHPDFKGCGNVAVGRYGDDPLAYIATLEPFHGNVMNLYTRKVGTSPGELLGSQWVGHHIAVYDKSNVVNQEGEGDGHHIIARDFDGDGNDEILVALRDRGVMYYNIIDLAAGRLVETHVSTPSAARIAVADFQMDGAPDFATIGYNVKGYYKANPCEVNVFYNSFATPTPVGDSPDVRTDLMPNDPNDVSEICNVKVTIPDTVDCIKRKFLLNAHCWNFELYAMPANSRISGENLPRDAWVKVIKGQLSWMAQRDSDAIMRKNTIKPGNVATMKVMSDQQELFADEETVFLMMCPIRNWRPDISPEIPKIRRNPVNNMPPDMKLQPCMVDSGVRAPMKFYNYAKIHFKTDDEFYNMSGFSVYHRGVRLVHMQWWLAGVGVDARTHNHSDLTAETTFCEIHACLVNGTGSGGMYRDETDDGGEQLKLIVPTGFEHGPFWEIGADGKPKKDEKGAVIYRGHKWKAGGRTQDEQSYDFWMAFEINPDFV